MNNNSKYNILILLFWIFLIFLFLNDFFSKINCNNEEFQNTKIKVYNFSTTWCHYCKKFQPIWDSFSNSITDEDNIIVYDIKCDDNKNNKLIDKYLIEGFPTIIIDYGNKFIKYSGPRTVNGLRSVLNLDKIEEPIIINEKIKCNNCNNLIDAKPSKIIGQTIDKNIQSSDTVIYNFNTSWCGYSVRFQPIWDEFAEKNQTENIKIIDVKCDQSENDDLCNSYSIEGFPTILKVKNNIITPFNGPRTLEGLETFL